MLVRSRRKHVTRFHLEISKLEQRREMPFEQRLSMLLEIITAVLPAKIRYTKSKNKRRGSKVVNSVPKGTAGGGAHDNEASAAQPQSP